MDEVIKLAHTIEDLWYGNITPAEDCGVRDPELEELLRLLERNREALEGGLETEQKGWLQKYADCYDEYVCVLSARAFRDGFCLASKLWAETAATAD